MYGTPQWFGCHGDNSEFALFIEQILSFKSSPLMRREANTCCSMPKMSFLKVLIHYKQNKNLSSAFVANYYREVDANK